MLNLFIIALSINSAPAQAADDIVACQPSLADTSAVAALKQTATLDACAVSTLNTVDPGKVKDLAAQHKGGTVAGIYTEPTSRTGSSVTYQISPEKILQPGEALYFGVPADLAAQSVQYVVLGHRQDPDTDKGWDEAKKWDNVPGWTSVQLHSPTMSDAWRYWAGDASGPLGSKFAEIRKEPEIENLHEWRKIGHRGVNGGSQTTEPLKTDAMRLVATGKDQVYISQITLKVSPPKATSFISHSFSPGTDLGDPETGEGQKYGGGQSFEGKFPGALSLPTRGGETPTLPSGWYMSRGALHIPVPKGMNVTGVDLAIGDSHPDGVHNKDGGWGTPGWSRVSAYLKKKYGERDELMKAENVPPEGVLSGTPQNVCYETQSGDEIVISARPDTAYLMGVRVGLRPPAAPAQ